MANSLSFRILFALIGMFGLEVSQIDIKTAFLYGKRKKPLFVHFPQGHSQKQTGKVLKTLTSVYGLCDAPRRWYKRILSFFSQRGFQVCPKDPCLFFHSEKTLYVVIYVDDMLLAATHRDDLKWISNEFKQEFNLNETNILDKYVGFEVECTSKGVFLSCNKYIEGVLKRIELNYCKTLKVPGLKGAIVTKDSPLLSSKTKYQSFVGVLNFISGLCRPDISFATNSVARESSSPRMASLKHAKRIFKYLRGTKKYGIFYKRLGDKKAIHLEVYTDSDFAADTTSRRSTTGFVALLNGSPLDWKSKKQAVVAQSTFEAEFIALAHAMESGQLILDILQFLQVSPQLPIHVHCDNQAALHAFRKNEVTKRSRHVDVKYHKIKNLVDKKLFSLKYISTEDNHADILTKNTCFRVFSHHVSRLLRRWSKTGGVMKRVMHAHMRSQDTACTQDGNVVNNTTQMRTKSRQPGNYVKRRC